MLESLRFGKRIAMTHQIYNFAEFELHVDHGTLLCAGSPVRLGSRATEILLYLVKHADEVVSASDLINHVWPGTSIDESNLRIHIAAIRRALSNGKGERTFVANIPGRGYRFTHPVKSRRVATREQNAIFNLPVLLAPLLGRESTLGELASEVSQGRSVTVVGEGGVGKTSVALAVCHNLVDQFEDGLCFVDLSSLKSGALISNAVATELRASNSPEGLTATIISVLKAKRFLLVVDNCEHVIEDAAILIEELLRACPRLSVLATSRESLRFEGENLHRLQPLSTPGHNDVISTVETALTFSAIQLFVQRAKAHLGDFELDPQDVSPVIRICRKLDGNPLAIELVAARTDAFDLHSLAAELETSTSFLSVTTRALHERHRTLQSTLDWSFRLLTEGEQIILVRLSVFRNRFTRDAAAAVATCTVMTMERVSDALSMLEAKSLLVAEFNEGHAAYRLLETTRAYAEQKLDSSPAAFAVRRRHAEYLARFLKPLEHKPRTEIVEHLPQYRRLLDDVRAALAWCYASDGDTMLGTNLTLSSAFLWFQVALVDEYRTYAERALIHLRRVGGEHWSLELRLLQTLSAAFFNSRGAVPCQLEAVTRTLSLAEETNDVRSQLEALLGLWRYHHGKGDYRTSLSIAKEYARRLGDAEDLSLQAYRLRAVSLTYLGDVRAAQKWTEAGMAKASAANSDRRSHFDFDPSVVLQSVHARALWLRGHHSEAVGYASKAVQAAMSADHSLSVCFACAMAGCPIPIWCGDLALAHDHLRLLEMHSSGESVPFWHAYCEIFQFAIDAARNAQSEDPASLLGKLPLLDDYRHRETLSVLGDGFAAPDIVERAMNDDDLWCSAEVLRREAVRLFRADDASRARCAALLERGLKISRQQGTKSWELRTAETMFRLRIGENQLGGALLAALRSFPDKSSRDYLRAEATFENFKRSEEMQPKQPNHSLSRNETSTLRRGSGR